jgi:hypothetical protein
MDPLHARPAHTSTNRRLNESNHSEIVYAIYRFDPGRGRCLRRLIADSSRSSWQDPAPSSRDQLAQMAGPSLAHAADTPERTALHLGSKAIVKGLAFLLAW